MSHCHVKKNKRQLTQLGGLDATLTHADAINVISAHKLQLKHSQSHLVTQLCIVRKGSKCAYQFTSTLHMMQFGGMRRET